jgi:biopolymer transport protein ExbD
VLIFLMVTTTFKQQPALKLVLPKSNQPQTGAKAEGEVIVTIDKSGMFYYKGSPDPVTLDKLQQRLKEAAAEHPDMTLAIRADTVAPIGRVVNVRDAAKEANIKVVNLNVDTTAKP